MSVEPLDNDTFALAALSGHLDVIKRLKCSGFEWDSEVCSNASLGGNIEILIFALENGCPWSNSVITNAALRGHLNIIEWCFLNKFYTFDANDKSSVYTYSDSCENASFNGHIHILKWFYVRGFPMRSYLKSEMYRKAAIGGNSEILGWLKRIGCYLTCIGSETSEESFTDKLSDFECGYSTRVNRSRSISMYDLKI